MSLHACVHSHGMIDGQSLFSKKALERWLRQDPFRKPNLGGTLILFCFLSGGPQILISARFGVFTLFTSSKLGRRIDGHSTSSISFKRKLHGRLCA